VVAAILHNASSVAVVANSSRLIRYQLPGEHSRPSARARRGGRGQGSGRFRSPGACPHDRFDHRVRER
jgi:hypothetical protein